MNFATTYLFMNLRVAKILILTIASFFTVIAASAALVGDTVECGGLYYKVLPGDSTLCLIAPAGGYTDEAIVIPPTVTVEKSYNVTAIGQRALAGNMALKQVSLPSTISDAQCITVGASIARWCAPMCRLSIG